MPTTHSVDVKRVLQAVRCAEAKSRGQHTLKRCLHVCISSIACICAWQPESGLSLEMAACAGFRPLYKVLQTDMNSKETLFAGLAGLRGSVSLILAQAVITEDEGGNETSRVLVALVSAVAAHC